MLILSAIALLAAAIFLVIFARRRHRERKERKHAEALRRELDLDFDTRDLDGGDWNPVHSRSMSDNPSTPLVRGDALRQEWETIHGHRQSMASFSGASVSTFQSYDSNAPLLPPSTSSRRPKSPVKPSSITTAEHQRSTRPSFPSTPRMVRQPSSRHSKSRSAEHPKPTPPRLSPLRNSYSLEPDDVDNGPPDSPESLYSQASAFPAELHAANSPSVFLVAQDAPPVPSFPSHLEVPQTSTQPLYFQKQLPSPPKSPELHDSLAFPFPSPTDNRPRRGLSQFYRGLWTDPESPTGHLRPRNSSAEYTTLKDSVADIISVHSSEVTHGTPQYAVSSRPERAETADIGYQLPSSWRADWTQQD